MTRDHMDEYNRACATAQIIVYGLCALSGALMASLFWWLAWVIVR